MEGPQKGSQSLGRKRAGAEWGDQLKGFVYACSGEGGGQVNNGSSMCFSLGPLCGPQSTTGFRLKAVFVQMVSQLWPPRGPCVSNAMYPIQGSPFLNTWA